MTIKRKTAEAISHPVRPFVIARAPFHFVANFTFPLKIPNNYTIYSILLLLFFSPFFFARALSLCFSTQ